MSDSSQGQADGPDRPRALAREIQAAPHPLPGAPGTMVDSSDRGDLSSRRSAATLLVVEDVARLAESLARGLWEEGFQTETVATGAGAIARIAQRNLDGVILDLGLPDIDGVEVLARTREEGLSVPVLVLTARDAVGSRVKALERGADDYLVKPFAFEELLARVRALLRRAAAPRWAPLSYCGVVLVYGSLECHVDGRPVALSPRERALLELFLRRRGETLGRREILHEAFGYEFDPGTNIVDVHVVHLRRKLAGAFVTLESVRGVGYRLAPVQANP